MPGTLYVIATPIGNLEDITFRAISTLKALDLLLCEDTRVTRRLLDRYRVAAVGGRIGHLLRLAVLHREGRYPTGRGWTAGR